MKKYNRIIGLLVMFFIASLMCVNAEDQIGLKVQGDQVIIAPVPQGTTLLDPTKSENLQDSQLKEGIFYNFEQLDLNKLGSAKAPAEGLKKNCDSISSEMRINKGTGAVTGSCNMQGISAKIEGLKFTESSGIKTFEGVKGEKGLLDFGGNKFIVGEGKVLKLTQDGKIAEGTQGAVLDVSSEKDVKQLLGLSSDFKTSGKWSINKKKEMTELTSQGDSVVNGAKVKDKTKLIYGNDEKLKEADIKGLDGKMKIPADGGEGVTVTGKSSNVVFKDGSLTLQKGTEVSFPTQGSLQNPSIKIIEDGTVITPTPGGFKMATGGYEIRGLEVRGKDMMNYLNGYDIPRNYKGNAISFSQGKDPFGSGEILKAQASGDMKFSHGKLGEFTIKNSKLEAGNGLDVKKYFQGDPVLIETKVDIKVGKSIIKGYQSVYSDPKWGITMMNTENTIIGLSSSSKISYLNSHTVAWDAELAKKIVPQDLSTQRKLFINPSGDDAESFKGDLCIGEFKSECKHRIDIIAYDIQEKATFFKPWTPFEAKALVASDSAGNKFASVWTDTTIMSKKTNVDIQAWGDIAATKVMENQGRLGMSETEAAKLSNALKTAWQVEGGDTRMFIKESGGVTKVYFRTHSNENIRGVPDVIELKGNKIRSLLDMLGFSY